MLFYGFLCSFHYLQVVFIVTEKSMIKIAGSHKKDLECVNIFQNKKFEKIKQ